uniref:site-specific integrase n=1 Tax=uncultured Bilophila sp. TaxID=529385 RepID=UPI00280AAD8D
MKTTSRIHTSPVSGKGGRRPDPPAVFPSKLASRWLDGLIAERGLSRNTVAAYKQDLDALRDFLDELETPLSGLDDENITLFIAWLRKRGDATRTLARRISSLRSFLAWCVERGELASNPAALIDTPKLPSLLPDVLTQDEIIRLLNAPDATSKL